MENNELLRRAEDLRARCERTASLTSSGFLTPAEQYRLQSWAKGRAECTMLLHGGIDDCERKMAFFLPYYEEPEYFDPGEHIKGIKLTAAFGTPGHRDSMGALLGMGVGREWIGDIMVRDNTAYVLCQPSVERHLLSIDKVGRYTVRAQSVALCDIPAPERKVSQESFSVMSMRLDAVAAGMFHLSRTEAAKHVEAGLVSLNYEECIKTDAQVHAGDIISLRGAGKGTVTGTGGTSRKGRLFVYAEICR